MLTGGGDCPGLNAVIRAVTLEAVNHGIEVVGFLDGFQGVIEDRARPVGAADVAEILTHGGTILGASNKANPSRYVKGKDAAGGLVYEDVTPRCLGNIERRDLDALVVIGGDGTMTVAQSFVAAGINCIGIPKTIDNDLYGTDLTFGFMSAVATATDGLDRVRTTAASHHRVIAVEVMGRNAGWLALHSGIASGADIVLIPEIPFSVDAVCRAVHEHRARGTHHSILCVAEGAAPIGGGQVVARVDPTSPDPIRFGGIAQAIAAQIELSTGAESRYVVLGHVQRGGSPVAADRVLSTEFGHHAMKLLLDGRANRMVALQRGRLTDIDIAEPSGKQRKVSPGDPLIAAARSVGIRFGDEAGT